MAVKQDTRQRMLFATSGEEKKCPKCGEFKSIESFYLVKKKDETRSHASYCKKCDNQKRTTHYRKTRSGKTWDEVQENSFGTKPCRQCGVNIWGQKNRRVCQSCISQNKRKPQQKSEQRQTLEDVGLWEWHQAAVRGIGILQSRVKEQQQSEWEKKCGIAVVSIRKRTFRGSGKDVRIWMTWEQRCIAAIQNLTASLNRITQDAWIKKCSNASLNLKRRTLKQTD